MAKNTMNKSTMDMGDRQTLSGPAPSSGGAPSFENYGAPGIVTEKMEALPEVKSRVSSAQSATE